MYGFTDNIFQQNFNIPCDLLDMWLKANRIMFKLHKSTYARKNSKQSVIIGSCLFPSVRWLKHAIRVYACCMNLFVEQYKQCLYMNKR